MNPAKDKSSAKPTTPTADSHAASSTPKNKDLKLPNFKVLVPKLYKKFDKHIAFAALILVLLVYIFVVFKISRLANAEPTPDQTANTATLIPKVNQNAINQIESLENNNTQVHTLFEQARNNPFQE